VLHVYTFKEGLLARLAHDLRLTLHDWEVHLEGGRVTARFEPASARVDGVARAGGVDRGGLSDADRRSIEHTLVHEILSPGAVRFEGGVDIADAAVEGWLTLPACPGARPPRSQPARRPLRVPFVRGPSGIAVDLELVPSRFGVPPYRALGGAIRLADRWRVVFTLPLGDVPLDTATLRWAAPG
jgi:hypothetical protein